MIPAQSGSHINCLKCVKFMGKTFYWPKTEWNSISFSNFLTFFRATTQIAFFGRNCALPFWNPGRNTSTVHACLSCELYIPVTTSSLVRYGMAKATIYMIYIGNSQMVHQASCYMMTKCPTLSWLFSFPFPMQILHKSFLANTLRRLTPVCTGHWDFRRVQSQQTPSIRGTKLFPTLYPCIHLNKHVSSKTNYHFKHNTNCQDVCFSQIWEFRTFKKIQGRVLPSELLSPVKWRPHPTCMLRCAQIYSKF
jgi:hypothetical protein